MDVLRRSRVLEAIDHAIGQHPLSEVSTGECVAVILAGVFVGAHSVWRIRERLAPYDMVTIMQDRDFDLARFPEERLAKALDDPYAFGLDRLMSGLALETIRQHRLETRFLHFDTTTLSFYGAYEREGLSAMSDGGGYCSGHGRWRAWLGNPRVCHRDSSTPPPVSRRHGIVRAGPAAEVCDSECARG
jgi:hypothetical protein